MVVVLGRKHTHEEGKNRMKVFILHGHMENVESILLRLTRISPARAGLVLPTREVGVVRRAVVAAEREESIFVVVTGSGLTTRAHNAIVELKNRYSHAVFLAYTSLPTADLLHGVVPRDISGEDHELVAEVLAFVHEGTTMEEIAGQFPLVTNNLLSVK